MAFYPLILVAEIFPIAIIFDPNSSTKFTIFSSFRFGVTVHDYNPCFDNTFNSIASTYYPHLANKHLSRFTGNVLAPGKFPENAKAFRCKGIPLYFSFALKMSMQV